LFYFNKLWHAFEAIDKDDDRRLTFSEFQHGLQFAGLDLSPADAQTAFNQMDSNHGGIVLFDGRRLALASAALLRLLTPVVPFFLQNSACLCRASATPIMLQKFNPRKPNISRLQKPITPWTSLRGTLVTDREGTLLSCPHLP
jgi:hypothetical protein